MYPGDASRADKLAGYAGVEVVEGDLRVFDDVKRAVQGGMRSITWRRRLEVL